ncbi:hypothetical protein LEL_02226 [Akanthomyces lecanii RCEF 1005]|uniref:Uncharacterized protein n=1 Tax=Akanthomyces lecanii RCEF 1005 TaxID=1081108 RepID=A0A168I4J5_CORDF|nr:hypothetical protein LEL_02226 [Akanthomyces lecanii RCEF 1005]
MTRSRSVSRRPSIRHRDDNVSPTRPRSRSSSPSSSYLVDRSRLQSRGPPDHYRREKRAASSSQGSSLSKSAGVLAGIGIAALVARKLWPKSSSNNNPSQKEHRGETRRRRNAQEHIPRGRDVAQRAHRQASNASSHDSGDGRYVTRGEASAYHLREPRQRSMDRRSWGGEDARSHAQSSIAYGRRYS